MRNQLPKPDIVLVCINLEKLIWTNIISNMSALSAVSFKETYYIIVLFSKGNIYPSRGLTSADTIFS